MGTCGTGVFGWGIKNIGLYFGNGSTNSQNKLYQNIKGVLAHVFGQFKANYVRLSDKHFRQFRTEYTI